MLSGFLSLVLLLTKATIWGTALILCLIFAVVLVGFGWASSAISFLAENWIIQTIFGAWVVFRLQETSAAQARKAERLRTTYDRKVEATRALYALIEKRIYASRRYLAVIESEPDTIDAERAAYRDVVREWNEKSKISQIPILLDFHSYYGLTLDNVFFPRFARIDALLRLQRMRAQSGQPHDAGLSKHIQSELSYLNQFAIDTVRDMLRVAREDRNELDGTLEIREENANRLSYGQLLKALVEPSP